ncbi:hypothetical protein EDD16DRAFT_1516790 [Pisolithus croceorrhizus]|nr:hypothetical protein EDD16DRAFT_1516790 [Pisolithus croceorrhizus]KAI6167639.1 hypothetical protein EDD17DRAFT_1503902 [Pisolithus thermaeus]
MSIIGTANGTPQNSATSDSQTGQGSHPPSSTVPSMMTKATSISSTASNVAPAYRKTPMSFSDEDKDGTQEPTALPAWIAGLHQPKTARSTTTSANFILEESNDNSVRPISKAVQTGYLIAMLICVELQTNVIANKPAKKLQTSPHGNATVEGSGCPATMTPSQVLSAGTTSTGTGHFCYINGHLPPMLQEDRKWTKQATQQLSIWHSNFGSTTLAIMPCVGCPDVPRLDTNALKEHGIKGAISLCCTTRGHLHVDDQISTCGKATARTPLQFNKVSGMEFHAVLKEIITLANTLITPTMDSTMLEDGSFPDDMVTDDLAVSNQHMSISQKVKYEKLQQHK